MGFSGYRNKVLAYVRFNRTKFWITSFDWSTNSFHYLGSFSS